MMDIRKLKELVRLMVENDLTELDLKDKDEQASLRRQTACSPPQIIHPASHAGQSAPGASAAPTTGSAQPRSAKGRAAVAAAPELDADLVAIESPMVGTFYASAGPDKPPFTSVGASVDSETVVCLIEAMKIFNEIKAERSGTIVRMLVQSGNAVEFGTKLFLVRPS
ncbi:MAG: acetyl-CoA carboxylase biotin carboxyl carrier protein [Phycisphaerales bacterium]|nr:acetyl-CoA carboxylase biotin carboxyl carrier protein [Phycisphaerales bacterium]